jgi:hypothetical protein
VTWPKRSGNSQLAVDLAVAADGFHGYRPNGGPISVPKGIRSERNDVVVERYHARFSDVTPREIA